MKRVAEREGFEPSVPVVSPYNGLAIISAEVMSSNLNDLQLRSRTKTHLMVPHSSISGHHLGQWICVRLWSVGTVGLFGNCFHLITGKLRSDHGAGLVFRVGLARTVAAVVAAIEDRWQGRSIR